MVRITDFFLTNRRRDQLITLKHSVEMKVRMKESEPKRALPAMGMVKLSTTNWIASAWVTKYS